MKKIESFREISGKWKCPILVTYFTENGAYTKLRYCNSWGHAECREWLTKKYLSEINYSMFLIARIHVFVLAVYIKGKELSNWIQNNLRGIPYWWIHSEDGTEIKTTIISARKFPGAERKDRRNFMTKILPTILAEPWNTGKRLWHSRSISKLFYKPKPEAKEIYYGCVPKDKVQEYANLKKSEEKAKWLSQQPDIKLYKEGKKLVRQYGFQIMDYAHHINTKDTTSAIADYTHV
jgi:hypothetical protein